MEQCGFLRAQADRDEIPGPTGKEPMTRSTRFADASAPPGTRTPARRRTPSRVVGSLVAVALTVMFSGCASAAGQERAPTPARSADIEIVEALPYWSDGDATLMADACLPVTEAPVAAVILLHGGGFTEGDRVGGGMRALCELMAHSGMAGISIDYRLAPDYVFPSQLDDVAHAVEWLRAPEQVERFGLDPAKIGLLGSSAGAILAQTYATSGTGPTDEGSRVGAVVSLSGVSLLTEAALQLGVPSPEAAAMALNYLGCTDPTAAKCPQAATASALLNVDPSDPPMFLVNGSAELVPVEQAEAMRDTLEAAGIPVELTIGADAGHGVQLLTSEVRSRLVEFLAEHL